MRKQRTKARAFWVALAVAGLTTLGFASGASAAHKGEFTRFNYCPSTTKGVEKCLQSITTGGEVVLGKKRVPIVHPVTLQGGLSEPNAQGFETMFAATNGETLTKAAQPVPGGLSGLVNCKEISNFVVRLGCESIFENGLTGVNATLELAKPASSIRLNELNLAFEEGTALELPVKVHLENPLLGSACYVGSTSSPLMWNLTTGVTQPPAGTAPIKGKGGIAEFIEEEYILEVAGSELVDNAWTAPAATGCGGAIVELILDPIINSAIGVPSAAGKNVAKLDTTSYIASSVAVTNH